MNFTNWKLIWRNLLKNPKTTSINILGLSISLAVCTLIVLFLRFEFSFDQFGSSQKDTYRLLTTFKYPNSPETTTSMSSSKMGPFLSRESEYINSYLRVYSDNENFLCQANGREIAIEKNLQVDSTFFSYFDFPLLHGDKTTVFDRLENILLTRPISESLFGKENPVGRTLAYSYALDANKDTTIQYIIAAVFDDLPNNSHLQFESITPLDNRQFNQRNINSLWHGVFANTYFKLRSDSENAKEVASKFPELLKKEMPNSEMVGVSLQAFEDIHLGSQEIAYDHNNYQKSDRSYLQILALVAIFILLISTINFANLSTVLAMRRVREVGVRKSLGASDANVFWQFMGEAMLLSFIGGFLALFWVEIFRESFLQMLGRDINLSFTPSIAIAYVSIVFLVGILSGLFPSFQAANYSPVQAFQRIGTAISVKRPFIKRLVVVQFVLSCMLIIGSIVCYKQLSFLQNKELGFEYVQILELDLGTENWSRSQALRKTITAIPGVIEISGSNVSLGTIDTQNGVLVRNEDTQKWENYPMSINRANHNYFDLYEMKFIEGSSPTTEGATNEKEFVVNESFVKKVGWKDNPIGKEVWRSGTAETSIGRVVGVIQDIHHNSLRSEIEPICFQASNFSPILSVKIHPQNFQTLLPHLQKAWGEHIIDRPLNYKFKDEQLAQLYAAEQRLGKILLWSTILSIVIACLGLFALSAFIIQQRTKEIGIRKVLGASTASLINMLSKDFIKLVLIALIIASPIAYYFTEQWLQDFAYRINIGWWVFVLTAFVAVIITFVTVSFQSVRAALANPVKSLRNE